MRSARGGVSIRLIRVGRMVGACTGAPAPTAAHSTDSHDHGDGRFQGDRFRHGTTFVRWRLDKRPADCRYDQLVEVPAFEHARIFLPESPSAGGAEWAQSSERPKAREYAQGGPPR